jgi:uncharacterized cupredoxin-like copper-binding protein
MFRETSIIDPRGRRADMHPQLDVGRLALLLILLLGALLYSLMQPAIAGERVMAVVDVKLTEYAIEMPRTMPPGPVTFSVTNAGTTEHNFEVEGEGIEKTFDTNLKPGETRNLPVDLAAGTYTISCPVDNHQERSMQLEIRVAEQRSSGSITPGEWAQLGLD